MMILQRNENAAMTTAAMNNNPTFEGNSDTPSIAIFVLNGSNNGGCAPLGAMPGGVPFADGVNLPPPFAPLDSLHDLIMRGISALGAGFGLGARTAGIIGLPDLMVGEKRAEGMAEEQLSAFFGYLKDTKNRADKTAQGYSYDAKAVLTVISDDYFNSVSLDKLDLSKITAAQVKQVVQKIFGGDDYKTSSLLRLKQGWNRFCVFVGMGGWKITHTLNTGNEYMDDVISNDEINKMLDYCKQQREESKTDAERTRWYRKEIAIRLGWAMGFRSCEYGNAKFSEVEKENKITIKNSKHNGTRKVGVTRETREVIIEFKDFLQERNLYPANGGIFEKPDGVNYSTSTFRRWLKGIAKANGIDGKQAKTHGLRHRFARNFHAYNHNEIMLADIMGHKSTATTRGYARQTFEEQLNAMQEANDKVRTCCPPQAA